MNKRLLAAALLLLPVSAHSADPNAAVTVQVVPPAVLASLPAGAVPAGFTTLAFESDFSKGMDIGCKGDASVHQWYQDGAPGGQIQSPCSDISLVQDGGRQVLDLKWDSALNGKGWYGANLISTINPADRTKVIDFGNAYYETTFRVQATPNESVGGLWWNHWMWWTSSLDSRKNNQGIEFGNVEDHSEFPWYEAGGCRNWAVGGNSGCGFSYAGGDGNFDPTQYHKYGMRITSDGSAVISVCGYVDDKFKGCTTTDTTGNPIEFTNRSFQMLSNGWGCNYQNGSGNCQKMPITNVYSCPAPDNGQICVKLAAALQYQNNNPRARISGVNGVPNANGSWQITSRQAAGQQTDWVLEGSSFAGAYTGGGMLNDYTRSDMYVQYVRVWSCKDWQTTMCNGPALTAAP